MLKQLRPILFGCVALALVVLGYSKPFEAAAESTAATVLHKAEKLSARLGAARAGPTGG